MTGNIARYEEQRLIAADPEAIFEILRTPADLAMVDPSGCWMEATGGPVDAEGDRFICRFDPQALDLEISADGFGVSAFDVEMVVSRYERNRSIAWKATPLEETDWAWLFDEKEEGGYDLEAVDGGTRVTDWNFIMWPDDDDVTEDFILVVRMQQRLGLAMLARTVAQRTGHTG